MNAVTLIGRLTRDPETRYTSDTQMAVTRFSLAIDRGKDKGADYPSIICFGKTAENCEKYLKKGRMVGIHGRIQTGSYEKDGHKVYTTDIVADRVEFLEKPETTPTAAPETEYVPDGYEQISEDIPF